MRWFIRDIALLLFNFLQGLLGTLGRIAGFITFRAPPNSLMRKTSSRTLFHYYRSGLTTYLPIVTMARFYGVRMDAGTRILDFGCGVGRQLLHLVRDYPEPRYFACDVDAQEVKYIQNNYPKVEATVNEFNPPLKYPDGSMDLIYSVSTFSHFDRATQELWLKELFRVTKPGGLCVLTTEGWRALEKLRPEFGEGADPIARLKAEGILYKEYLHLQSSRRHKHLSPLLNSFHGIGASYGNTVMTPEFIKSHWTAAGFEVLGISEGVIDSRQDLVALRRPL